MVRLERPTVFFTSTEAEVSETLTGIRYVVAETIRDIADPGMHSTVSIAAARTKFDATTYRRHASYK